MTVMKYTYTTNIEVQSLQSCKWSRSDGKQTGMISIEHPAGELLIFAKGVGSNENEGGSYDVTVS
jgi:hypothetical protein